MKFLSSLRPTPAGRTTRICLFVIALASAVDVLNSRVALAASTTILVPRVVMPPSLKGRIDGSWAAAAKVELPYDFAYRRAARDMTTANVQQDPGGLDIAIDAEQRTPLSLTQTTNGSAVYADDYVSVALWPQGIQGFAYTFAANALGARFQSSTENSSYSPQWEASGTHGSNAYTITMRIPFNVIRAGGSRKWRVQIVRSLAVAGALYAWTYSPEQTTVDDPVYAGTFDLGSATAETPPRPQPRLQVYGLGQLANENAGGSTSRIGGDLSLPLTATASLLATVHPDYSNVEIGLLSIAPNEFPRQYAEVRPFFTQQAQNFNNTLYCATCPLALYTPAVPTFRDGYAVEGTHGPFSFDSFETDGYDRNDAAEVLNYNVSDKTRIVTASAQNVAANAYGIHDDVSTLTFGYEDVHSHLAAWMNSGQELGTFVSDASKATWLEAGVAYTTPTTQFGIDHLHIGPQFNPVDGYVSNNDLDGWSAFASRSILENQEAFIRKVSLNASISSYDNSSGGTNQEAQSLSLNLATRSLFGIFATAGSSYLDVPGLGIEPFTQNAVGFSYRAGTSTPASSSYDFGRYYQGALTTWYNSATVQLPYRTRLSLEVDRTRYVPDEIGDSISTQWLERSIFDVQLSRYASVDFGARRILGISAPTGFAPPSTLALNATNITAAFHLLNSKNELYLIYGQPNSLSTTPIIYVKFIRYIGAEKGT